MRDYKCAAVSKLQASRLSFTTYICGFFLDYFGYPHAPTYLPPMHIVLDTENHKAAIPGDGETPVVFTYTKDVGRFAAASLELAKWPEKAFMIGDKVTLNELLRLAQNATGTVLSPFM
jgi:nucleoside-diphosphate-sugar epimerase